LTDQDALERAVRVLAPHWGLRATLLAPLDDLQARLSPPGQAALAEVRAAFPEVGPFSYVPLGAFLWQWAAYGGLLDPAQGARASINHALTLASDSYARSPLFKALLLTSEGQLGRFLGVFGQWGSLFVNHGKITTARVEAGCAQLVFSGYPVEASMFYIPGLLRGWMRHFDADGEVSMEVEGPQQFRASLRW
jgi:hypothetical protein